jgi:integrase
MASIIQISGGRKAIQFYNGNGQRKTLRLGKITSRDAERFKTKIEELNAAKINGTTITVETSTWLAQRPTKLYGRLVRVGLAEERPDTVKPKSITLADFINTYISKRSDVKGETAKVYKRCRNHLISYFGENKPIDSITVGDAADWRRWLKGTKKLSSNTVGRTSGIAKQFFHDAVDRELLAKNPFSKLSTQVGSNEKRYYFLSQEDAQKVIDACPDAQWRLLFALSRYGGLRCPSEHLALRWKDVDWVNSKITIHSTKTEHHNDGGVRVTPLFPELRPYLEDVRDLADKATEFVITRYRDSNSNLRTQLERIIQKAGLKTWPKLFQNLRSSRETELAKEFPMHVVCKWIGNTEAVARKHYLQVTDADYEKAVGAQSEQPKKALRKALRSSATLPSTASSGVKPVVGFLEGNANPLFSENVKMGGTGLEPVTPSLSSWCSNQLS